MKHVFEIMEQTSKTSIKAICIFYILAAIGTIGLSFTLRYAIYLFYVYIALCVIVLCIFQIWRVLKQLKQESYQQMMLSDKKAYLWSELLFHSFTFVGLLLVLYFSWLLFLVLSGHHSINDIVITSWNHAVFKSLFPYNRLDLLGNLMFWMNIGIQCYALTMLFHYKKYIFICPLIILDVWQIYFKWQYPDYSVIFHMLFYIAAWVYAYLLLKRICGQKRK